MRGDRSNRRAQLSLAYDDLGRDIMSGKLRVVGNYTLQRTIGRGTFGRVRRATHRLTNTPVAVKQIPKAHIASLTREIHHHRRLQHPNIVQLFEVLETESSIWLASELCSGGELYDYLVARGAVPEPEARVIFGQLCLAVAHIHSQGIVHRDLKLENILLDDQRNVKLSDFGFTREFEPRMYMETYCGTTAYAAPEMLDGRRYLGQEADIWSLGIILFVLLCGYLPYDDDDERVMRHRIINSPVQLSAHLSAQAQALINSILQKDGSRRPKINDILSHEWFSAPITPPEPVDMKGSVSVSSLQFATTIDFASLMSTPPIQPFSTPIGRKLYQQLDDLGFSLSQIEHSVATYACDSSGALWWILYRKAQQRLDIEQAEAAWKATGNPSAEAGKSAPASPRRKRATSIVNRFKSWIGNDGTRSYSTPTTPRAPTFDAGPAAGPNNLPVPTSVAFPSPHQRTAILVPTSSVASSGSPGHGSVHQIPASPAIVGASPNVLSSSVGSDTSDEQESSIGEAVTHRMLALQALEHAEGAPLPKSRRPSGGSVSSAKPTSSRTSLSWRSSGEWHPRPRRYSESQYHKLYRHSACRTAKHRHSGTSSTDTLGELLMRHMSLDDLALRTQHTPISAASTPQRPRSAAGRGSPSALRYSRIHAEGRSAFRKRRSKGNRSRGMLRYSSMRSGSSGMDELSEPELAPKTPRRLTARRAADISDDDWVDVDDDRVFGGIGQVDVCPPRVDRLQGLGLNVAPPEGTRRANSPVVPAPALTGHLAMLGQPVERSYGAALFPGTANALSRSLKARRNMNTSIIEEE